MRSFTLAVVSNLAYGTSHQYTGFTSPLQLPDWSNFKSACYLGGCPCNSARTAEDHGLWTLFPHPNSLSESVALIAGYQKCFREAFKPQRLEVVPRPPVHYAAGRERYTVVFQIPFKINVT